MSLKCNSIISDDKMNLQYIVTSMTRETISINDTKMICFCVIWVEDCSCAVWLDDTRVVIRRQDKVPDKTILLVKMAHTPMIYNELWHIDTIIHVPPPLSSLLYVLVLHVLYVHMPIKRN